MYAGCLQKHYFEEYSNLLFYLHSDIGRNRSDRTFIFTIARSIILSNPQLIVC